MADSEIFQKTLSELEIKPNNAEDRAELHQILTYILCYPSLQQAQIHHRSCNMGTNDLLIQQKQMQKALHQKKKASIQTCACCGLLAQNQRLPYCTSLKELNLGVGVFLFFNNYLYHTFFMLLMFLIYSLFALITNILAYNQNKNTSVTCIFSGTSNGGCGLSPLGAGSKVLNQDLVTNYWSQIQAWIGVAFVSLWGLLYIIKTHTEQKFIYSMEQKRIQASDFTLMLTHIPRSLLIRNKKEIDMVDSAKKSYRKKYDEKKSTNDEMLSSDELKKNFNVIFMNYGREISSQYSYEVMKVNVAKPLCKKSQQDIQYENKLISRTQKNLEPFRELIRQKQKNQRYKLTSAQRDELYNNYMNFCEKELERQNQRAVNLADDNVVFVTLRYSGARREIQERNEPASFSNFWNLCKTIDFPIKGVKVRKAPHPDQLKWHCVGFPLENKRLRRFFMWILTLILIGVSLGISIGISFINTSTLNVGVSVGISIVVTAVNIGIQIIIAYTSYFEKEYISSREQTMTALKIGLGQLVNSIGVPIIVTLISQAKVNGLTAKPWLKSGGLVDDVFFIAALNVLVPIAQFFDPWEMFLRFVRRWYSTPRNRLKIHGQLKFNKYFGNYQFDIGYEYAYLVKTVIFTSFFVCMQPIIAIFAPIGLGLYYLATKRNLFYHFKRPHFHLSTINSSVDFMLLISMCAFGFGCLFVNNFIESENNYLSNGTLLANWIIVMVAAGFVIVVPLKIFYCCIKKPTPPEYDFIEKKMLLRTDYDRLNPETKHNAISEFTSYLQDLQQKNQLPAEADLLRFTFNNKYAVDHQKKYQNQMLVSGSRLRDTQIKKMESETKFNDNLEEYREIAHSYQIEKIDKTDTKNFDGVTSSQELDPRKGI